MARALGLANLLDHQVGGRRNLIINGAMKVAQRGTSETLITTSGYYTADRFQIVLNSLGTWTQTREADAPTGFSSSLKMKCTTAAATPAAGSYITLAQQIEGQDLQHLGFGSSSAQPLTLSFWVKSNKTGTATVELQQKDNSDVQVTPSYTINAANTWEHKVINIPADTSGLINDDNGTGLWVFFWLNSGANFTGGTNRTTWTAEDNTDRNASNLGIGGELDDEFYITGVQLELGDTATPFEHRSYGEELELCKRYYQKSYDYDTVATTNTIRGMSLSAVSGPNLGIYTQRLHPQMRDVPDVVVYDQPGTSGRINVQATTGVTVNGGADINGLHKTTSSFQINNVLSTSGEHFRFHFVAESEL